MLRRGAVAFLMLVLIVPVRGAERGLAPGAQSRQAAASNAAPEIGRIREQWVQQLHAKQLDQIMTFYAPDAVFLSPNGRFTGPAAIRGLFKNIMESVTSNLSLHSIVTETSGDLAYESGDYRETLVPAAGGPTQALQGDYLVVFKRQPDGRWLIAEHVWTLVGTGNVPAGK
jgi:ketosteroid isomerase-like protein